MDPENIMLTEIRQTQEDKYSTYMSYLEQGNSLRQKCRMEVPRVGRRDKKGVTV